MDEAVVVDRIVGVVGVAVRHVPLGVDGGRGLSGGRDVIAVLLGVTHGGGGGLHFLDLFDLLDLGGRGGGGDFAAGRRHVEADGFLYVRNLGG